MQGSRLNINRTAGQWLSKITGQVTAVAGRLRTSQLAHKIRTSLQSDGDNARPILQRADERYAILTQTEQSATSDRTQRVNIRRLAPVAVRLGAAGFIVVGGWLAWRGLPANAPIPAEEARGITLQPTFTSTPVGGLADGAVALAQEAPAAAEAAPMQIIIVTPTPNAGRQVTVGGAIIDRPLAVAGAEQLPVQSDMQPAVAGLGVGLENGAAALQLVQPVFDPSAVVIPPLVEELVSEPLAQVEVIPLPGLEPLITPAATLEATFTPPPTPTPLPELEQAGPTRKWAEFLPLPPEESDHLWVGPAFLESDGFNQIGAPSYAFGSTGGGRYRPHHGLDVANPWGTPVRAGVSGEVVHAGMDDPMLLGPYNNFYGNAVVIRLDQKISVGSGDLDVFLLYGHLSEVSVQQGQHVGPEDLIGKVGMTGIAIGPHLHVEMRIGANTYQNSANPYLWLKPLAGNGAVAVRVLTADGRSWPGARLTLARFENGQAVWGRMIETYLDDEGIGPDPIWGENGAMGDVPAGYYILVGNVGGESVRAEFFVREGQTTFVEVRTQQ